MALGIYGTNGTNGTNKMPIMPQMPLVPSANQYLNMEIPDQLIQQIRATSLTDIICRYVKLRKLGSQYVGKCPFHQERTPSFSVHPTKGYHCFGCGAEGNNPVDFIMAYEGKTFPEAVEKVAGMAGIDIDHSIPIIPIIPIIRPIRATRPQMVDYIPEELVTRNLASFKQSNLFLFFASLFGEIDASNLCKRYGVGSCDYYGEGTTLFIQRDINGNIRQVKVILYVPGTGKRNREPGKEPRIIGRQVLNNVDVNLQQTFFGCHLLTNDTRTVAIVESEKTAMICSLPYPQFLWIATGGKNGASLTNPAINIVLKGREIHLFPDVDGIEEWHKAAAELQDQGFEVFLNDTMAANAESGSKEDIADLILQNRANNGILLNGNDYPVIWDNIQSDFTDQAEFMQYDNKFFKIR